jgi:hypothetical protein
MVQLSAQYVRQDCITIDQLHHSPHCWDDIRADARSPHVQGRGPRGAGRALSRSGHYPRLSICVSRPLHLQTTAQVPPASGAGAWRPPPSHHADPVPSNVVGLHPASSLPTTTTHSSLPPPAPSSPCRGRPPGPGGRRASAPPCWSPRPRSPAPPAPPSPPSWTVTVRPEQRPAARHYTAGPPCVRL